VAVRIGCCFGVWPSIRWSANIACFGKTQHPIFSFSRLAWAAVLFICMGYGDGFMGEAIELASRYRSLYVPLREPPGSGYHFFLLGCVWLAHKYAKGTHIA